jgi:hypothetical protein
VRVLTTKQAVVMMALATSACAAAAPKSTAPARPPLRPAEECAEVRARVDRGDIVAGRDTLYPATPLRVLLPHPRQHGELPRDGRLMLKFFVSLEGRAEPATLIAEGLDGYASRNAIIADVLALPYRPGELENCAVRTTTTMWFSMNIRR